MAKNSFTPRVENKRIDWMINFAKKLPNYKVKYNLTDAQVQDVQVGAAFVSEWYGYRIGLDNHSDQVITYNGEMMDGTGAATASQLPAQPGLPVLAAPAPGIFVRAIAIGKSIKTQSIYTDADGMDMGLVGTESALDVHGMKPTISVRLISGGHPEIVWKKLGMDGVEIYKDGGDGNFALLAYDTYPNYIDTTPLPEPGKSAIWKYKAIYKYRDEHAGEWGDVVSVVVAGN